MAFITLHDRLVRAGRVFPLEDRFAKAAAYLDTSALAIIDLRVALDDFDHALQIDPYGPDLLQAKLWLSIKAGDRAQAEQAAHLLQATEGCIDCWMHKQ